MDPSIMKLLEEDEDESMHSGADVEAFQAALNRDIGGDVSTTLPGDSEAVLSRGTNQASSQGLTTWKNTVLHTSTGNSENTDTESILKSISQPHHTSVVTINDRNSSGKTAEQQNESSKELNSSVELQKHSLENPDKTGGMDVPELEVSSISGSEKRPSSSSDSHSAKMQKVLQKVPLNAEQPGNLKNSSKQIPFVLLLPALKPHLDKDREMQLQTLFNKLRKNEIPKDQFVRLMRNIVGDQVLKLAVSQMQMQQGSSQAQMQLQSLARQQIRPLASSSTDSHSFDSPHAVQGQTSSHPSGTDGQKNSDVDRQVEMQGKGLSQISSSGFQKMDDQTTSPLQVQSKQPQAQFQYPQTSFSMYGNTGTNYQMYPGTNVSATVTSIKPLSHDIQVRPLLHHQTISATQSGQAISSSIIGRQSAVNDPSKIQSTTVSYSSVKPSGQSATVPWRPPISREQNSSSLTTVNFVKEESVEHPAEQKQKINQQFYPGMASDIVKDEQLDKKSSKASFSAVPVAAVAPPADSNAMSSRTSVSGNIGRTPPKKPAVGQKKPLDALSSPPQSNSKKQKVSGAFLDQSIEQLNDVTAVSGVNLSEEEEQLLSAPKDDSRVSEASRKVVQEEEDRLILERVPLRKKLTEIMVKYGLKSTGNDVERCLSLCVEERIRGLLCSLIRLSKQRVDTEKSRHRTVITSDVRQQIMLMNRKAKEEWEKKQAEAEKFRKVNESDGDNKMDGDKDKDDGRQKPKANKEEDDKMRTNAANVAARAAVGVDDMLSKWQLMAQARQKREGASDPNSVSHSDSDKDANRKSGRNAKDSNPEAKRSATSSSGSRKFGRSQAAAQQARVARTISVKDIISVLERESQMSKSTLIYRLYEKIQSEARTE